MAQFPSAVRLAHSGQTAIPIPALILPNKHSYPAKILRCDVVFGSPSMDCSGTGICKLNTSWHQQSIPGSKNCQLTFGLAAARPDGGLSLFFFPEFLCMQLYRKHFQKGILAMTEACPISSDISKKLNISATELLPGNYSIIQRDGYYRVDFNCA
ncbi:MAG: hypothetical protein ACKVT2_10380 [Saprospiraceae bacterium]